jgi:hypothetical protein
MILNRNPVSVYAFIILLNPFLFTEIKGQGLKEFDSYVQKYPHNSVIISSLKQDLVIEMINGKPVINLSEYKEYLALDDNANYFADSKERFGGVYKYQDIQAYTLVPDNEEYKKIPVTNFTKTSETFQSSFYDDGIAYNFTFPSVVKGAKMISKIRMSSDDPSFPYRFYFGNYFSGDDYVFTVTCPENVNIRYKIFGRDTSIVDFSITMKAGKKVYSWHASNQKTYISISDAPDIDYYMPHVIIQISEFNYKGKTTIINNSLDDLYKLNYSRISDLNLSESSEIIALTDSLTKGLESNKDKVRQIYNWVQKNIKYIAIEDGENGYIPREASLVLQRKYGDCKDKTSLMVAMMRSQGLKASYSWIGTRDIPYKFSNFATRFNSNHMVAVWWDDNNNPVILDGTTLHHAFDDIPAFIQGKECLIEKGPSDFAIYTIPIASPDRNTIFDSLMVELKGDTLVGNGICIINGELRSIMLDCFEGKDSAELPKIVNELLPKASNKFIIESVSPITIANTDAPLKYNYKFYLPDYLTVNYNFAYLNLNLDRFPSQVNIKDDRWIPIELNNTCNHIFICTFIIPDGYEIRNIPNNASYYNELFGFDQSYELNKNVITIKTTVTLNFQVIEDKEMDQFREMLSQLNTNYLKTLPINKTAVQ